MSERFKASNGIEVAWKQEGTIPVLQTNAEGCTARVAVRPGWEVVGAQHPDSSGVGFGKGSETHKALREFFQHERDEELGRWRWPENPDYVVSLSEGGEAVWVLNEREAGMLSFTREMSTPTGADEAGYNGAARAYFAAHPEPKPWHDAKPGEVWVLTTDTEGEDHAWMVDPDYGGGRFVFIGGLSNIPLDHPDISAGRRIWPEVSCGCY